MYFGSAKDILLVHTEGNDELYNHCIALAMLKEIHGISLT